MVNFAFFRNMFLSFCEVKIKMEAIMAHSFSLFRVEPIMAHSFLIMTQDIGEKKKWLMGHDWPPPS